MKLYKSAAKDITDEDAAILEKYFVGKGDKEHFSEKDADAKEFKLGIKVELEHTPCRQIAKWIALDHLVEIPDYYTRLIKMEEEAKKEAKKEAKSK